MKIKEIIKQPEGNWEQELQQELDQESLFMIVMSKLHEYRLIEWTIKDKPNSPKQKFTLTKRCLSFCLLVKNK
jgi:hypothetical protein